jgi:flagellar hook-associated protein 1 FlgK
MASGQSDVTAERLGQVESALGESSTTGLGATLNKFWSSWSQLANNPNNASARTAVAGAAKDLADAFNALDGSMGLIQGQTTQAITDLLGANGPIKPLADELGKLNFAINQAVQAGQQPNDLLDRRDLLLDKLSGYGQVSITPDATYPAMLNVSFAGAATPLVDQTTVTMPTSADISATPGGQLGGLLGVGATIAGYRTTLDTLANTVATAVNTAHGSAIFTGAGAGGIAVTLPVTINAGSTPEDGANDIALAIAAMRGTAVDKGWANLVTQIGGDVASAKTAQMTQTRVLDSLTAQRTSVNGVSLDEEMTNMVRFQRAYQASARVMSTMDEALDTIINRTGRVGL